MANRARIDAYAFKEGVSFNAAKRALGAKHAKGSRRAGIITNLDDNVTPIRRGPVAGTGKPKGGSKT